MYRGTPPPLPHRSTGYMAEKLSPCRARRRSASSSRWSRKAGAELYASARNSQADGQGDSGRTCSLRCRSATAPPSASVVRTTKTETHGT